MSLVMNGINPNAERHINDFYATDPQAVKELLKLETFNKNILEPCAGMGHIAEVLKGHGYKVTTNDLFDYGYKLDNQCDILNKTMYFNGDIITNPPYKGVTKYITRFLDIIPTGNKVACFLKLTFLETLDRYNNIFKDNPPKIVYISVKRSNCAKRGRFDLDPSNAIAYAWFVWEKGWKGDPIIKWFNYE